MAVLTYDNHGIRFEYPQGWELDETDDGLRVTASVSAPDGVAFAIVTADEDRPDPEAVAGEALAAMREEYPSLEAVPANEEIGGQSAVGHDVDFFSLDVANSCVIRCYRSKRRTVLVFAQWADIEGDEPEEALRLLKRSLEETDA